MEKEAEIRERNRRKYQELKDDVAKRLEDWKVIIFHELLQINYYVNSIDKHLVKHLIAHP